MKHFIKSYEHQTEYNKKFALEKVSQAFKKWKNLFFIKMIKEHSRNIILSNIIVFFSSDSDVTC